MAGTLAQFSGLDGFTNTETRSFYEWIDAEKGTLTGVREIIARAESSEDLGNRLLNWFMCFLHEQPGSNVFYNTIVEKAILGIHWNELGERLFAGPAADKIVTESAPPSGGMLLPCEQSFLDWVLAEKGDALAGLAAGGADAVAIMEYLEGILAGIRVDNTFVAVLLEKARRDIRLSLVTSRILEAVK
jgi:hypothetical protein